MSQNIYLEGIEIFKQIQEFDYLEAKNPNTIKEVFKKYQAKVGGRITKYHYNQKEFEELINSEPELLQSIESKLAVEKNIKRRDKILDNIVNEIIKIIKEDEDDLEKLQSVVPSSESKVASGVFENKEKFKEMLQKLYRGIKYINFAATKDPSFTKITISTLTNLNAELFDQVFEQLNDIENEECKQIASYFKTNNLIGSEKILWPEDIKIKFPEILDDKFINKYFAELNAGSTGEKKKESTRLNRKAERMNVRDTKKSIQSVGGDVESAIQDLKNSRGIDNDTSIDSAVRSIIKSHKKEDLEKYLLNKVKNSRYNFDSNDTIKSRLREIIATEISINKRGRRRKS